MQFRELFEWFFSGKQKRVPDSDGLGRSPSTTSSTAGQMYSGKANPCKVLDNLMSRIWNGRLEIPYGMTEIPDRLFDGPDRGRTDKANRLVSVVVPGSVRRIGIRAFGNCENLEEVILSDGVEDVGSNAFTGCKKLTRIRLPASIREIDGWAFYHSGLTEPVFSADGKVLVYYPQTWKNSEYSVPEGVETIGSRAFIDAAQLTKVNLPQSLKRICFMAFIDCGFTELTIPKDTVIEDNAFSAKHNVRIVYESECDALEKRMDECRINGISFLCCRRMRAPQEQYWKEEAFRALAQQCAEGKAVAMDRMADYFLAKAEGEEENAFYPCAAQFWRVRAYRYGSDAAKRYLLEWSEANPDARMVSPCLDERLNGSACGESLNALGFLFFQADREYSVSGVDAQGVVEVSSWESEDGPDEDGFGREEYYDWWYLNEHLILPDGIGYIGGYSNRDKRCNEKKFLELHDRVAAMNRN